MLETTGCELRLRAILLPDTRVGLLSNEAQGFLRVGWGGVTGLVMD